ncbi:MAG: hemolysin family protein [Candidatus Latescibacterota bacterium]
MITAFMFIGFIISLLASVMFSGAEQSVGSISRDSLEKLHENNITGADTLLGITSNKRRFHLMLQSGRIISITGGTILLYLLIASMGKTNGLNTWCIGVFTFVFALAFFILTDGILSKIISVGENEKSVPFFASFVSIFYYLFIPLTFFCDFILSVSIKKTSEMAAKEDALIEMVKSESESGVIEQEEGEMIQSILNFYDTTVREVMVPRMDVAAAEKNISIDELILLFKNEAHSRIPVYDGRIDNIIGVIYSKDLLIPLSEKDVSQEISITNIMRKPYFVPETKNISELLRDMKKEKVHLAIVVDEYGGTSGIVALEDLLEEIVGDIQDEYDKDGHALFTWIDNRTVVMDASLNIDDVNEILHTNIPNEDFDTLAGFIYHTLGSIPESGEEIIWNNVAFTIKEIVGNRISKVSVKLEETRTENQLDEE